MGRSISIPKATFSPRTTCSPRARASSCPASTRAATCRTAAIARPSPPPAPAAWQHSKWKSISKITGVESEWEYAGSVLSRSLPFLLLLGTTLPLSAKGIYSRSATSIGLRCDAKQKCPVVSVLAPDGRSMVRRIFRREKVNYLGQYLDVNIPNVEVVTHQGRWPLELDEEWMNDVDVLWSSDSKFVALTGGINGYTESLRVFAITESGPKKLDATLQPSGDMLRRFPPCRARHADLECPQDPAE